VAVVTSRSEGATAEPADAALGERQIFAQPHLLSTSAVLGDPGGDDTEKHTSDDDGDRESD